MMNDKYKSKSIVEALHKLRVDIPNKIKLTDKEHDYLVNRREMREFIKKLSQSSQHIHSGWLPYMQEVIETKTVDGIFWAMLFKRLAEDYEVPHSWVASIRFKPVIDYTLGSYLIVSPSITPLDKEGCAFEIFYSAHLDGVESGMITDDTFLFQRQEEATMATNMASEMLEQIVEAGGFESKEDFLSQFSHEYDMHLPSYENDDSP
tara:strand:- start:1353 stop:1970 length:618 start_codon:yes stop_codon:yes gene_type:complete